MKKAFYALGAITIFMICAWASYALSAFFTKLAGTEPPPADSDFECLLSIQVDRLDVQRPQLITAWVTLLYFDQEPYKINFLQIYPDPTSKSSQALGKEFVLDGHGAPASGFWRAFNAFKTPCKDYIMIDEYGTVQVLNWINGRTDMENELKQKAGDDAAIRDMLESACDRVTGSANRSLPPFRWEDLAPRHIHTNLLMENALLYWERAVNAPPPGTCSVSK